MRANGSFLLLVQFMWAACVFAGAPRAPGFAGPLLAKDLTGTWIGRSGHVQIRVAFTGTDDATLRLAHDRATVAASLRRVEEESGSVGLRLDYRAMEAGENRSEIIARIERRTDGVLVLSVLPVSVQIEPDYCVVNKLPLHRTPTQRE